MMMMTVVYDGEDQDHYLVKSGKGRSGINVRDLELTFRVLLPLGPCKDVLFLRLAVARDSAHATTEGALNGLQC